MKVITGCTAASFALLSLVTTGQAETIEPHKVNEAVQRPVLQLNDHQRAALLDAVRHEDTEQKTPASFEAKVGAPVPLSMTIDVLPPDVVARDPSVERFAYAKLAKEVLVIDPMKKTIIAVLPRPDPNLTTPPTGTEWAQTRGRELTGQAPMPATGTAPALEPAGDSGDKANGSHQPKTE